MRRSLEFARVMARRWTALAAEHQDASALSEGRCAYALEHAAAYQALHTKWAKKWQPLVDAAKETRFHNDVVGLGVQRIPDAAMVIEVEAEDDGDDEGNSTVRRAS